jgi:hypothetical protein
MIVVRSGTCKAPIALSRADYGLPIVGFDKLVSRSGTATATHCNADTLTHSGVKPQRVVCAVICSSYVCGGLARKTRKELECGHIERSRPPDELEVFQKRLASTSRRLMCTRCELTPSSTVGSRIFVSRLLYQNGRSGGVVHD